MQDKSYNWKKFFDPGEIAGYFFRKRNTGVKPNFNLKVMHLINRVAIILFLASVIYLVLRHLFEN
jgi:hypothetical protein